MPSNGHANGHHPTLEPWSSQLLELRSKTTSLPAQALAPEADDRARRALYRDLDVVITELQEALAVAQQTSDSGGNVDRLQQVLATAKALDKELSIQPASGFAKGSGVLAAVWRCIITVDALFRGLCVVALFITLGMSVAVPLVLLTKLESEIIALDLGPPLPRLSTGAKRILAQWMLLVTGVRVRVEGRGGEFKERFQKPALIMFTHASNLDPLIMLSAHPCGFRAIVKHSIFAVPYLGWLAMAFGCVPIDRSRRDAAVASMTAAGEECQRVGYSLAVSPEGTRSRTGQLRPFKKGAFHLAQQLRWPMLPLTIHGAFALWPPRAARAGALYARPGTVGVRYHALIRVGEEPSDASAQSVMGEEQLERDRCVAAAALRESLLGGLENPPKGVSTCAGAVQWAVTYAAAACSYWLIASAVLAAAPSATAALGLSGGQAAALWLLYTASVTIMVYIGNCGLPGRKRTSKTHRS